MSEKLSKIVLPIKNESTGQTIDKEFEVGGSGNTNTFVGTTAEWNALTSEQQNAYDCRVLTDDDLVTPNAIIDSIYPVGSLYMSINNTMPSALTEGRTWELLSGDYVLKTITEGTGGQTSNAGNTGSTTLTAAQSGVPAHNHGLNSHTHSIPALSGTAASKELKGSTWVWGAPKIWEAGSGILTGTSPTGKLEKLSLTVDSSGSSKYGALSVDASHSHSVTTNASTTGQATGSTANNSAANASQGHTHTAGMPQNIGVYVWKRTA